MDHNTKKERIKNLKQTIEGLRRLRNHIYDDLMKDNYGMNQVGIQQGYALACREIESAMDYLKNTENLMKVGMPKEID